MVACGRDGIEKYYLTNPKLIVEVLSPTTEAIDRREKALHYRQLASLEEYALVAQESREGTLYRREHNWADSIVNTLEGAAEFRSIDLTVPLAEIYAGLPAGQ
jgi:Uma2 family endonuclease